MSELALLGGLAGAGAVAVGWLTYRQGGRALRQAAKVEYRQELDLDRFLELLTRYDHALHLYASAPKDRLGAVGSQVEDARVALWNYESARETALGAVEGLIRCCTWLLYDAYYVRRDVAGSDVLFLVAGVVNELREAHRRGSAPQESSRLWDIAMKCGCHR
jgi:hypothetical protein